MTPSLAAAADGALRAYTRLEWGALPEGPAGLLLVAAAAGVLVGMVWLYRRERPASASRLRPACAALRLAALAVLATMLLRPTVAHDVERVLPSRLVIALDVSASMSVRDAELPEELSAAWQRALGPGLAEPPEALSRHELARRLLAGEDGGLLRFAARRHQVEVLAFAGEAEALAVLPRGADVDTGADLPERGPSGAATDLAGALAAALDAAPERLAGVVLLTDGQDTAASDLVDAARRAQEAGVPVHFVGAGSPLPPRNVRAVEIASADHGTAGLPLSMSVLLRSRGYEGRSAELVLTATGAAAEEAREVLRRDLRLAADGRRQAVDMTHVPPLSGSVLYEARVAPLGGEWRAEDNAVARRVLVSARRLRVLLAAGAPSREVRFLQGLIARHPAFELEVRLPGGAGPAGGPLPEGRDELAAFDVVLLCDPAPAEVGAEWLDRLADLCSEEGLGLAFVAGPLHTAQLLTDDARSRLRDLLPVSVPEAQLGPLIAGGGLFERELGVGLTSDGRAHPVTQVAGGTEAATFWRRVPGVYWALPGARAKRGATTLLRSGAGPDEVALVATQAYGLGRVFYCGSPETWRWRRLGIGAYERFWLGALRYCAGGRQPGAGGGARIVLPRSVYTLGEGVPVQLRITAPALRPGPRGDARLAVEQDGRTVAALKLRPVSGEEGAFGGVFQPPVAGRFDLVFTAPDRARVSEPLDVKPPELELRDLRMDEKLMRDLASRTGGRYVPPDELAGLIESVPDRTRTVVEPGPPEPLWDTPYLLALLTAALAAEWIMRKRMGLL
jgi:hypothetical protein